MHNPPITYRIALGGTLASFCLLALFITGVLPMFYLIMPMLCSLLVMVMASATSPYWAFIMYLAVSTLSVFITPNKDACLIFILFFGHYPLLRPYLSRIRPFPLRLILKLILFNLCMAAYFGLMIALFGMAEFLESTGEFGKYGVLILVGMLNVMFLCYDFSLVTGMEFYRQHVLPKLHL
jgi:hypothetical protein